MFFTNRTKSCYAILATIFIISVFFSFMLPKLVMDNELRHFFPKNHSSNEKFKKLTEIFGDQYVMDIVVETDETTILDKRYLDIIRNISDELLCLDNIVDVKSLTNIDFIADVNGTLSAGKLIDENFTGIDKEIKALKQRILEWPQVYVGTIISSDFKGVQIVATLNSDITPPEISILYKDTVKIVERNIQGSDLVYKIAGDPVLGEYAKIFMYADLSALIPLITIVVLLCLFFSFKNIEGTLLPLLAVLISTLWTAGIMAVIGEPFTIVSSCLPVLLIAVGSAYGIHIINYYYQRLEKEPFITDKVKHQTLVLQTVREARAPVLLAGITTIAGFISTITSPISPLKSFAVFSTVGIAIALCMAFLFIPSVLMLKSVGLIQRQQKRMNLRAVKENAWLASFGIKGRGSALDKIYAFFNRWRSGFVCFILVIVVASVFGITKLNIESAFLEYFPKSSKIREDVTYIDTRYVGTTGFSFVVEGVQRGDMCKPEILKQMDNLEEFLKARHPEIGTVLSFTEFIKRMNRVMHAENPASPAVGVSSENSEAVDSFFSDSDDFFSEKAAVQGVDEEATIGSSEYVEKNMTADDILHLFVSAYAAAYKSGLTVTEFIEALKYEINYRGAAYDEIPYDVAKYGVSTREELQNIISQYLLLYSGSLDALLDESLNPLKSRMQVIMRTHDTGKIKAVINDAQAFAAAHFPAGYTLEAAGLGEMETAMTSMIISSQISSLVLAVVIVFCILSLYYRSVVAGLIGAIPLAVSILFNFAIMSLTGINLDMVTSMVAAIAIGIGIDYTVHFMNNYHNERIKNADLADVTLKTLRLSGKGIAVNAFSVGCGFLVMCFSKFVVLRFIGFLVATVMLTSSAAALTVLPVLLNIFKPKFMTKVHTGFIRRRKK